MILDEVDQFIGDAIKESLDDLSKSLSKMEFYNLPSIDEENSSEVDTSSEKQLDKSEISSLLKDNIDFVAKLIIYLENKYPNIKSNFEYLVSCQALLLILVSKIRRVCSS
jgi:hypothetical protein